jgi:hypothetical protein
MFFDIFFPHYCMAAAGLGAILSATLPNTATMLRLWWDSRIFPEEFHLEASRTMPGGIPGIGTFFDMLYLKIKS